MTLIREIISMRIFRKCVTAKDLWERLLALVLATRSLPSWCSLLSMLCTHWNITQANDIGSSHSFMPSYYSHIFRQPLQDATDTTALTYCHQQCKRQSLTSALRLTLKRLLLVQYRKDSLLYKGRDRELWGLTFNQSHAHASLTCSSMFTLLRLTL